jgi:hypothetical protein
MTTTNKIPAATQPYYEPIAALIDRVCREHLNEEYAELGRKLAGALARKRPSPIVRGKPNVWAAGIVHAIGLVNFLFDSSQTPHIRSEELAKLFGVGQSTMSSKSKQLRDSFDMGQLDPNWCLPSKIDDNPMVWMLMVNGFIVDVRTAPRDLQAEAFRKGLIPYIPADRVAPPGATSEPRPDQPRCGLCGSTTKPLTRTDCCNHWICDDADNYVLFSYARNSCHRNHERYTLCSYHHNEGHAGNWQDCEKCRAEFDTEIYVYYGTNDYNFEKLPNPPAFEPTHCAQCGKVISLSNDGYSMAEGGYYCERCTAKRMRQVIQSERVATPHQQRRGRRH